jgi:hypothetical protein
MKDAIDLATVARLARKWKESYLENTVDWSIDYCRFDEEGQLLIITGWYVWGYNGNGDRDYFGHEYPLIRNDKGEWLLGEERELGNRWTDNKPQQLRWIPLFD